MRRTDGRSRTFRLTDAGTGRYTGSYLPSVGQDDLELFVVAQDVNDADPDDPPIVQAGRLGGIVVSTPEIRSGRPVCDARIAMGQAVAG